MSMKKRLMTRGLLLLGSFFVILGLIFTPIFPGKMNGLDYMDNLFNMISKGSSYFIPKAKTDSEQYGGRELAATAKIADEKQAQQTVLMLEKNGIAASVSDGSLQVRGDLGKLLVASLEDADHMFNNNGTPVTEKYGFPEREVLYNWWTLFKGIGQDLTRQEQFADAKIVANVSKKGLEPAYNYYGVKAMNWQDNIAMILVALGFYVIYTLWYGFGIMYVFEGLGLKIGH